MSGVNKPQKPAMGDEEIEVLTTHLPHELTMLQYSIEQDNASSSDPTAAEKDPRRIMAFECFWLHARNLIEFFRTDDPKASTVSPHIFTETKLDYGFSSKELMDRINAQITHLQRPRGSSADPSLTGKDMINLKEQIDMAVERFQEKLTSDAKEWWSHRLPVALCYETNMSSTACTEIQMVHLDSSRAHSLIFSPTGSRDSTISAQKIK